MVHLDVFQHHVVFVQRVFDDEDVGAVADDALHLIQHIHGISYVIDGRQGRGKRRERKARVN